MKKLISTKQTTANIAKVLRLLADTSTKLIVLSEGLSEEQRQRPLAKNERSLTQVLAHLLNCEARTAETITLALLQTNPLVANIHPERQFGKLIRLEQLPFADLLIYFKLRRTILLNNILTNLTEQQWARTSREEGKKRQESVYWQARSLALHELEHLTDIEHKLKNIA